VSSFISAFKGYLKYWQKSLFCVSNIWMTLMYACLWILFDIVELSMNRKETVQEEILHLKGMLGL